MNELKEKELLLRIESLEAELRVEQKRSGLVPAYLAGLSHDIRTPLNAIMGFSHLITDQDVEREEIEMYSQMILRSSSKLLHTMSNLVDYAKIETNNMHLKEERVNVSELFEELREEMEEERSIYGKQEVDLQFKAPFNGGGFIATDRNKLHQVLRIFLDNSLKFTSKGSIELLSKVSDQSKMLFSVRDTGNGMDSSTVENVFHLFPGDSLQEGSKMKSRGLGMVVANKLIHLMNGQVSVNSSPKEGTTVSVSLPY